MRVVAAVLLGLVVCTNVTAADWVALSTASDKRSLLLADAESLHVEGALVEMWQMETISPVWTPDKTDGSDVRSYKRLLQFDCKKRRYALVSYNEYELAWGSGKLVNSSTISNLRFSPITPETIGETLYKYACGSAKVKAAFAKDSANIIRSFTLGD